MNTDTMHLARRRQRGTIHVDLKPMGHTVGETWMVLGAGCPALFIILGVSLILAIMIGWRHSGWQGALAGFVLWIIFGAFLRRLMIYLYNRIYHFQESRRPPDPNITVDTPLHEAAGEGNAEAVASLVADGADVNAKGAFGQTPLYHASSPGIAEMLIAAGADPDARAAYGLTPLYNACYDGRMEIAALLIARGADVNATDDHGYTPLHSAGHREPEKAVMMAGLLLSSGADIDRKNCMGKTPLFEAIACDRTDVIEFLLSKGAGINEKDREGNTPLHEAASRGNPEVIRALVAHGADVNGRNNEGDTPLHSAGTMVRNPLNEEFTSMFMGNLFKLDDGKPPCTKPEGPKAAEALIACGAEVNARNSEGLTPLFYAHVPELAQLLIEKGADVSVKSFDGMTPLHDVSLRGSPAIAALLISRGADVNALDGRQKRPLHHARRRGLKEMIRLLEAHGARE